MWQIHSFLRIWPHLLKKSLMENFIFCAVRTFIDQFISSRYLGLNIETPLSFLGHFHFLIKKVLVSCFVENVNLSLVINAVKYLLARWKTLRVPIR